MDVKSIRKDFPLLNSTYPNGSLTYFDNACMSLRPQPVIDAINYYYTHLSACAGRSNHRLARELTQKVAESRASVARLLNAASPEEVVFVKNTTEALNLVAHSLELGPGDLVLTTDKEHNSNLVPWLKLSKLNGFTHQVIKSRNDNTFDLKAFAKMLTPKVKLVSVGHTANLDGVTVPLKDITDLAHKIGALVMADGAQSAPHRLLDVKKLDLDFLAFSGHKMLGPTGIGVLYAKRTHLNRLDGFLVGGDTVESTTYTDYTLLPPPDRFEAGLQHYSGILGLKAAVDYLLEIGLDHIHQHEVELNSLITQGLADEPRFQLIGPKDPDQRGGIISFNIEGVDPHQVALMLDQTASIMVRSGQHCVHSWFNANRLKGSVRASLYLYNDQGEAERFVTELKKIISVL